MQRQTLRTFSRHAPIAFALLFITAAASAQTRSAPPVRPGTTELGAFVGSSFGLDSWRAMGGGNVSYSITRVIMPYGEYSYFPGIQREAKFPAGTVRFSVPVSDVHAGVHLRAPLGERSRVVPYAVIGAGMLRYGDANVKITFPTGGSISDTIKGESNFAANFGGGLRFYVSERVGFRYEAKVYKPTGKYTTPFYKMEGGIFIQFHKSR